MLRELHVRGLGPLGEVEATFGPGLNVVTGETGAGKTLLVTSLALLSGARASPRLVARGSKEAIVQAVVDVPAELGGDGGDEVVLARRIGPDGRSRAWIGGRLVPVSALAELCAGLIEIHGQGAGFALAEPSKQLDAIDALAELGDLVAAYRTAYRCVRDLAAERERLAAAESDRAREIEFLLHQADEIDHVAPKPGERQRLEQDIARLEHAEHLVAAGERAVALIGPDGAAGKLSEAEHELTDAARIDGSLSEVSTRVASLALEAADVATDLRRRTQNLEADPRHLDALRERLGVLASLERKHSGALDDVIAKGRDLRRRAEDLGGASQRIGEVDRSLKTLRAELGGLAADLTSRRRAAADRLASMVGEELPALALPAAVFRVECEDKTVFGERGRDEVRFTFSADGKHDPEPIGRVASGGELSRTMIAVTLALARAHRVATLVFDEADQGVGGETALDLARRLRRLGSSHQVLVVSHLPQLAAFADHHVLVVRDDGATRAAVVEGSGRLAEISRMLAGLGSSGRARAHAQELLDLAASEARTGISLVG